MSGFTQSAKTVLKDSRSAARQRGASQAAALDVLIAAIRSSPSVAAVADGIHLDWHDLLAAGAQSDRQGQGLGRLLKRPVGFDDETKTVLVRATTLASGGDVSAHHLAAAALEVDDDRVSELLAVRGTDRASLRAALLS